ncbi:MAG: hypothetical protein Q8M19_06755 [Reyranella sp.]|nr:hypothetical protein [Reyranella sp.]
MQKFPLAEPVTLFWRKEERKYRADSRYFGRAEDAIVWAFEALPKDQRRHAYLRFENDHRRVSVSEVEKTYQSIKST